MVDNIIIEDSSGLPRSAKDVELVEEVLKLKNTKDYWAVIDKLLEAWSKRAPDEVSALQIEVEDHRENLIDKKFATTKEGKHFDRRFKMIFPRELMVMIRAIYKPDELPMDDAFMTEFANHYPFFKIAEKD